MSAGTTKKEASKMKMKVYNPFHCPEGWVSGYLEAVEEVTGNGRCVKQVRLRFRVTGKDGVEYLAAKSFCATMAYGSELYNFILCWLDGDIERFLDDQGEIDLATLIGRRADLWIKHGPQVEPHKFPFANIMGIFPPGTASES